MGSVQVNVPPTASEDARTQVLAQYERRISYYWKTSQANKRSYKATRYLTIILGALVTLVSALANADFVTKNGFTVAFAILTPVLAASMAIVGGCRRLFSGAPRGPMP